VAASAGQGALAVVFLCLAALYESWAIPCSVILVVGEHPPKTQATRNAFQSSQFVR